MSSNSFTRFGIEQHDTNHTPVDHSYFPTATPDNGPFVGQMNHHNMSRVVGLQQQQQQHSGPHRMNLEGGSRANEYPPPSSNIPMEVVQQPFVPPFPPPPITENRSLPPGGHTHYTNYNVQSTHELEAGGPMNHHHHHPTTGKRKRSGSLNNLYAAGSSSGSSSSSQMPMEKQTIPPPYRGGSSLTIDGQDSSRNVRRRYTHSHRHDDMESTITATTHLPNHFYQSPPPHPPNYSTPVPHYPLRLPPPDISGSRHEMTQLHGGGSSGDSVFSRHPPSSQNLHHHANHSRRIQSSYGNGSSRYSQYAHGGTSSMRTPPESFSSRNSRHCSPGGGWRGSYRTGRPRLAVERFHSVVDVTESHDRIGHEAMMMVDRTSFYGNSRNFSDQYRDLRLDIDNMSYEELLNLEERIGSVNTGLSEDSMCKYLREKVYCSSDQNHEEVSCPICLEEYKNGDNIGRMEKCGHGYHVECIKKWLLMKKVCPICKTECSNQEPREG